MSIINHPIDHPFTHLSPPSWSNFIVIKWHHRGWISPQFFWNPQWSYQTFETNKIRDQWFSLNEFTQKQMKIHFLWHKIWHPSSNNPGSVKHGMSPIIKALVTFSKKNDNFPLIIWVVRTKQKQNTTIPKPPHLQSPEHQSFDAGTCPETLGEWDWKFPPWVFCWGRAF